MKLYAFMSSSTETLLLKYATPRSITNFQAFCVGRRMVLGLKPRASYMLGKFSTAELHPSYKSLRF